jgi:hypothetical protein
LGDKQNWTDSADLAMLYQGPFTTDFYRQLHVVLHKEFRAHRSWRLLQQVWSRPSRWHKQLLREMAAMLYGFITLPWARFKLRRLTAVSTQHSIKPAASMSHREAAQPSIQESGES